MVGWPQVFPADDARNLSIETSYECVPAPTFGQRGRRQCSRYVPDLAAASDGLVPSATTVFAHPQLFGDKLQARTPSPRPTPPAHCLPQ